MHDWGSSRVPGCGDVRERKVTVRCIGAALRGGRHKGPPRGRVLEGCTRGRWGLRGVRRTGFKWLGLSPLRVRQRRLALSAHAHSTLAKGAHHRRAGLG